MTITSSILEISQTLGRVCKFWAASRDNTNRGAGDFLILRDGLNENLLSRLEQKCKITQSSRRVASEKIDKRYVFDIDWDTIEDIFNIPQVRQFIAKFRPKPEPRHFMRNIIVEVSDEIGSGGGWHRDSFMPQLKIFIPLVNVTEDNGALQYASGTSGNISKLLSIFQGRRKSHSYNPSRFETLTMKRGDLAIVNTSGIHRGSPPSVKGRDMITVYMNENFK